MTVIPAGNAAAGYTLAKELTAGGSGGWKLFSLDDATRRLYAISSSVATVDLDKDQIVKQFTNVASGIHAFAVVPKYHRAFYLAGQESKLNIVDLNTFKPLSGSGMKTGSRPEAILIEPYGAFGYILNAGDPAASGAGALNVIWRRLAQAFSPASTQT